MRISRWWLAAAIAVVGVVAFAPSASAATVVKPFGVLDCVAQSGVRFCEGGIGKTVKSWDGTPLDVNVTLPAKRNRNLPLIVQLHGWGGHKTGLSDSLSFAQSGYAVLNYSARGFGDSCGSAASRAADPGGCAHGWVHLGDSRYEIRDTQYLAGLLADAHIGSAKRIGVMGQSYGGGQSMQLAVLRDRMRLTDGSYVPWLSPKRKYKMQIAAAAPIVPWSDLAYSLQPNGRTLDYTVTGPTDDMSPIGVAKQSYVSGLYLSGAATGYIAPPGADSTADITNWFAALQAGEPYGAAAEAVEQEVTANHSAYYLPAGAKGPAPTLLASGTTDDLFPPGEALRFANKYPNSTIATLFMDFGHPRGTGKLLDLLVLQQRFHAWFDKYVKKRNSKLYRNFEMLTQTCPSSASSGGPFAAKTWAGLHPGEVRYQDANVRSIESGSDALGPTLDPIGGGGACAHPSADDQAGTATYRMPAVGGNGYTLMGSPTVIADVAVSGAAPKDTAIAARLFDVAPDNTETMVARGIYRPGADGQAVFQLSVNGWTFAPGHVPKLELLGSDQNYMRTPNGVFSIAVSNLDLRLPVHEAPGGQVGSPAAPVLPPGATPVP